MIRGLLKRSGAFVRSQGFWLAVILMLAFILRIFRVGHNCFFGDEIFVVKAVSGGFGRLFTVDAPFYPPLYYYFMFFWTRLSGAGEAAMRLPSCLFSAMAVYFTYKTADELFNKRIAIISAALAAFSPFLVLYSRAARWYGLYELLAIASVYLFLRAVKTRSFGAYIFYIITTVLLLYTSVLGLLMVFAQWIAVVFIFRKPDRKWMAAQSIIFILYIPWIAVIVRSFHGLMPGEFIYRGIRGGWAANIIYSFYSFSLGQTISPFNLFPVLFGGLLFLVMFIWSVTVCIKRFPQQAALLSLFIGILLLKVFTSISLPHYMLDACLLFFILIAVGIDALKGKMLKILACLFIAVIWGYSLLNLYSGTQYHRLEFLDDWMAVARFAQKQHNGNALVICNNEVFGYYYKGAVLQVRDINSLRQELSGPRKRAKRMVFIEAPLSGIFRSDMAADEAIEKWLRGTLTIKEEEDFSRDEDAVSKRRFVPREFPEYRIKAMVFGQ